MIIFGMAWRFTGFYFLALLAIGVLNQITGFDGNAGGTAAAIVVIVWVVVENFAKRHNRYLSKSEYWMAFATFLMITTIIDFMVAVIAMSAIQAPAKVWAIGLGVGLFLHAFSIWIGFWGGKRRLIKQGFHMSSEEARADRTLGSDPAV